MVLPDHPTQCLVQDNATSDEALRAASYDCKKCSELPWKICNTGKTAICIMRGEGEKGRGGREEGADVVKGDAAAQQEKLAES